MFVLILDILALSVSKQGAPMCKDWTIWRCCFCHSSDKSHRVRCKGIFIAFLAVSWFSITIQNGLTILVSHIDHGVHMSVRHVSPDHELIFSLLTCTLSSRSWVNFYITILPTCRLSIFGHQIVHGGYISTRPVCQWPVVFGYYGFLHEYNWNIFESDIKLADLDLIFFKVSWPKFVKFLWLCPFLY